MRKLSMNFFLKYNFLYAPMRYRIFKLICRHFNTRTVLYLLGVEFKGEKYLNTFIVTNTNDCPNLLSYGATFRMGVPLPNYPQDIVVKGENVPHYGKMSGDKMRASNGTSNVFQILGDIWKQQLAIQSQSENPELASPFRTTTP